MRSTDPKPELPGKFVTPIALGTILQPLNSSMIAVALVGIHSHFDAGTSVTWLVSALYLATAVAAPAMGRIADVLGPRRISLAGIVLVGATSAVAPFAPNVAALVVCRILIGIGTAAQYPCDVAMIRRAADRFRSRPNNALPALAICSQVTAALGPSLGGLLVGGFGWAGVFWINVAGADKSSAQVTALIAVSGQWPPLAPRSSRVQGPGGIMRSPPPPSGKSSASTASRPRRNARGARPLPEPFTEPGQIRRLEIRRRDRLAEPFTSTNMQP